jgi:hypothetical protein
LEVIRGSVGLHPDGPSRLARLRQKPAATGYDRLWTDRDPDIDFEPNSDG